MLGFFVEDVVDVLFENCSHNQGKGCEDEVVKGDIHVIVDCLARVAAKESVKELGNGEKHVFVKKVQNHLTDSDVIPPSMHEQQPPQHPELRKRVVTRLHSALTLFTKQTNSNVCSLDHWNVVSAITYSQCDLFEFFPDQCDNFSLL